MTVSPLPPLAPVAMAPPPLDVVRTGDRPEWLRRGRIVLAAARDSAGRAGMPALHRVVDASTGWARGVAGRLKRGTIGVYDWFRTTLDGLIARHYAGTLALTRGETPPPEALDDLDGRVAAQAGYLARFRSTLAAVGPENVRGLVGRAGSYAGSIWATGINVWRKIFGPRRTLERWVLDDGPDVRHCPDCPGLDALGWVPIGELPELGSTACGTHCRCHVLLR